MLNEQFVREIAGLARKASDVEILQLEGVDADRFWTHDRLTGEIAEHKRETPGRDHLFLTLESFGKAVERWKSESSAVFIGDNSVEAVLDDGWRRRDRLSFPLTMTPEMAWLAAQDTNPTAYSPLELVMEVRSKLARCVPDELPLLLRNVKFSSGQDSSIDQSSGSVSLSQAARKAALFGGKEPPENFTFEVFAFHELSDEQYRLPVLMVFEVDARVGKCLLVPAAGELTRLKQRTRDLVATALRSGLLPADTAIFHGVA